MTSIMTDMNDDEVDWSEGTIDDPPDASALPPGDSGYNSPPSASTPPSGNSGYTISSLHGEDGHNHVVEPQKNDEYIVPTGTPLSPGMCRLMAKVSQLTVISCRNPFYNKETAPSNRRTSEPPPAVSQRLSSLRIIPGESEGVRGHLSQGIREACSTTLLA
jgi:hypothetical protein